MANGDRENADLIALLACVVKKVNDESDTPRTSMKSKDFVDLIHAINPTFKHKNARCFGDAAGKHSDGLDLRCGVKDGVKKIFIDEGNYEICRKAAIKALGQKGFSFGA